MLPCWYPFLGSLLIHFLGWGGLNAEMEMQYTQTAAEVPFKLQRELWQPLQLNCHESQHLSVCQQSSIFIEGSLRPFKLSSTQPMGLQITTHLLILHQCHPVAYQIQLTLTMLESALRDRTLTCKHCSTNVCRVAPWLHHYCNISEVSCLARFGNLLSLCWNLKS